jgi:hypothetical protein
MSSDGLDPGHDVGIELVHRFLGSLALFGLGFEHEGQKARDVLVLDQRRPSWRLVAGLEEEATVANDEPVEVAVPLKGLAVIYLATSSVLCLLWPRGRG